MVHDAAIRPATCSDGRRGNTPRPSPDGMPWRLEPGSDLVVQLHLQPTGKPETGAGERRDFSSPTIRRRGRRSGCVSAARRSTSPRATPHYDIADRYVLPVDVEVLAVQPHAHNLGATMEATRALPDGTARPLIAITTGISAGRTSIATRRRSRCRRARRFRMRYTYDNSAANPRNPHQPPQRVVWGQNTTDEMGDLWLQVVPRTQRGVRRRSPPTSTRRHGPRTSPPTRECSQSDPEESAAPRCGGDVVPAAGAVRRR